MSRRTRFSISILVSLSLLLACIIFMPARAGAAQAGKQKEFKYNKVDEQRAVNLTPAQLEKWASVKGYQITSEIVPSGQGYILEYTVIHKDTAGEVYKKLLAAGSTALKTYVQSVGVAIKAVPKDVVMGIITQDKKTISDRLNKVHEQGLESVVSIEGITAIEESLIAAGKKGELNVISRYVYDSMDSPARYGNILMSKKGRGLGYEIAQEWRDAKNGQTKDGYSIVKDKDTWFSGYKFGYYYKQDTLNINGDDYWLISVKPY